MITRLLSLWNDSINTYEQGWAKLRHYSGRRMKCVRSTLIPTTGQPLSSRGMQGYTHNRELLIAYPPSSVQGAYFSLVYAFSVSCQFSQLVWSGADGGRGVSDKKMYKISYVALLVMLLGL